MPEDPNNIDPWIDPELEARIVAMVLGEASDFEKAELERLVESRPELALFRDRIKAACKLATESGQPLADDWKMDPARRKDLREQLGLTDEKPGQKKSVTPNGKTSGIKVTARKLARKSLMIAAAVVAVLLPSVIVLKSMVPGAGLYKSSAAFELHRELVDYKALSVGGDNVSNGRKSVDIQTRPMALMGPSDSPESELEPNTFDRLFGEQQIAQLGNTSSSEDLKKTQAGNANTSTREIVITELSTADQRRYPPTAATPRLSESDSEGGEMRELLEQAPEAKNGERQVAVKGRGEAILSGGERASGAQQGQSQGQSFGRAEPDPFGDAQDADRRLSNYYYRDFSEGARLRAKYLGDVDSTWEMPVPESAPRVTAQPDSPKEAAKPADGFQGGGDPGSPGKEENSLELANGASMGWGSLRFSGAAQPDARNFLSESEENWAWADIDSVGSGLGEPAFDESMYADLGAQNSAFGQYSGISLFGRNLESPNSGIDLGYDVFDQRTSELDTIVKETHGAPSNNGKAKSANEDSLSALSRQKKELESARKEMLDIAKRYGIDDIQRITGDKNRDALTTATTLFKAILSESEAKAKIKEVESQLESLSELEGEELIEKAVGLGLRDTTINQQYGKYQDMLLGVDAMKDQGRSDNHPAVKTQKNAISKTRSMLLDGAENVKANLRVQLEMAQNALKAAEGSAADEKDAAMDEMTNTVEYVEAKKDYELKKALYDAMLQKHSTDTIDLSMPKSPIVLYEKAQIAGKRKNFSKLPVIGKLFGRQNNKTRFSDSNAPLDTSSNKEGKGVMKGDLAKSPPNRPELGSSVRSKKAAVQATEKHASIEPFSTFSLHVSDVSFKLAQAALLKNNERPTPDSVRPEEFVNAFDYGDKAPAVSEKIACTLNQAAHPFLQQRNLLRVAMRTAATGRNITQPLHLTLMIDRSGSMEREDRQQSVLRAMKLLATQLGEHDSVTVIGFARTPRLIAENVPGAEAKKLVAMIAATPSEGGTNLEEALKLAGEQAQRRFHPAAENRIVLLTDGAANLGDADPERLHNLVETLRQKQIAFDACGVGADGLNDDILEALTRTGDGRYYFLDRPEDADAGFARQLAGALRPAAKNVKIQIRFNPKRVGHYRLIGFEKHRLKKEDFRNDAVAAAALAAAESGIALYQIETLPDGSGEVGEVSVRFRDSSSRRMVERTFVIRYNPRAEAFEESAPALKLAGTAAFLAEKLRGGINGDAIQLGELIPVMTDLRQHYHSDERVGQLLQMIEKTMSLMP